MGAYSRAVVVTIPTRTFGRVVDATKPLASASACGTGWTPKNISPSQRSLSVDSGMTRQWGQLPPPAVLSGLVTTTTALVEHPPLLVQAVTQNDMFLYSCPMVTVWDMYVEPPEPTW